MDLNGSEASERYRILVEYSYDGLAMLDGDGNITYVCPASERILGLRPRDIVGKRVTEFLHPDEAVDWKTRINQLDAPVPAPVRARHRDGYWRWLEVVGRNLLSDPEVRAVVVNFRDVHDRKMAEERLKASTGHFRLLVEGARDYAMMLVDREGRITSWNPGAQRILGYAEHEILGKPFGVFFTPEDRASGMDSQELEAAARTGRSLLERWHVRKDGSRFFAAGVLTALEDAETGARAFSTILSDVTEKRLAEEALLRSQRRYVDLVDSVDAIVWEADGATRAHSFVSRKAGKILGLPAETLIGPAGSWEDRIHPADRQGFRSAWADAVRESADFVQEYRMLNGQGKRIWMRDHASATRDPGQPTYRGVAVDITPLKDAEIRLRLQYEATLILASETQVERAVAAVLETAARNLEWDFAGLWLAGPQQAGRNRFFHWSSGRDGLREFGEAAERESRGEGSFAVHWPSTGPHWVIDLSSLAEQPGNSRLSAAARSGMRVACIIPVALADRILGSMEFYSSANRESKKEETEILATLASQVGQYVERTRAEAALRESAESLRQSQKMEAVGRLAGGIAHDFNNLLTAINGYSDLLLSSVGPGSPLKEGLEEIRKAGERAAALTRQLLAFGRRQMLAPKVINLNTVVTDMEAMLRTRLGPGVTMNLALDPDLAPTRADPGQIKEVLLNLVDNAREAMPKGGKLTIETARVSIPQPTDHGIGGMLPGDYSVLTVTDDGVGMDEAVKARIFDPYFTTKPLGKGAGLGLSMVDGVIRQSGGHVSVSSEIGKGTSIGLYLPVSALERRGSAAPPGEAKDADPKTILVVEDEESLLILATRILEGQGYRVLAASSANQALETEQAHPGPIHLLLADMTLRGMTGQELASRVRVRRPGLQVLYTSGYSDDRLFRRLVKDADGSFIPKPFTASALAERIGKILEYQGEAARS